MFGIISANTIFIICFLVGIALLVLEAFIPGFGVSGVTGLVLEVIALVLCWNLYGSLATLGVLLAVLFVLAVAISLSLKSMTKGKLSKSKLILRHTEDNDAGYRPAEDLQVFVGREGTTTTVLRPAGIADFEGVRLDVVTEGTFINAGEKVRIIRVEGSKVLVRPL